MSTAIAEALRALDRFPVRYRTTATDTVIEAENVGEVFAAVEAAHRAIPDERVITSVEVDEDRRRPQDMQGRVASVERELGRPAQREAAPVAQGERRGGRQTRPSQGSGTDASRGQSQDSYHQEAGPRAGAGRY